MNEDYYHEVGLSSIDLRTRYLGKEVNQSSNHLYVNVVAVKREYQGGIRIVKKIAEALEDILQNNFDDNSRPEKIYAVAVSKYGENMCEFFNFKNISVATRVYGQNINKRILYTGESNELLKRLRKVSRRDY
ncbi:hypothetical protein GQR36_17410 [Enterococcus termitis]